MDSSSSLVYEYPMFFEFGTPLDDFRMANYKQITFDMNRISSEKKENSKITIEQNFHLDKGGIFWDGAFLLLQLFLKQNFLPEKTTLLEMGCGPGLTGIGAGYFGFKTIITDLPKIEKLAQRNVELNKNSMKAEVIYTNLEWGNEKEEKTVQDLANNEGFDVILGSELIYIEETFPDLVGTFNRLLKKDGVILITYRTRMIEKVEGFMKEARKFFKIEEFNKMEVFKIYPNLTMKAAKLTKIE